MNVVKSYRFEPGFEVVAAFLGSPGNKCKMAGVQSWGAFFFNGPGRSRYVIDGPGPTGLARGKRTVTVIAYRLFHSPED